MHTDMFYNFVTYTSIIKLIGTELFLFFCFDLNAVLKEKLILIILVLISNDTVYSFNMTISSVVLIIIKYRRSLVYNINTSIVK